MAEQTPAALGGCGQTARRTLVALVAAFAVHAACAQGAPQNPDWQALAPAQREILAPLAGEWDRLDPASRKRWLGVAPRYPKMTPLGQKRVQTRMKKWATLSPRQREEARENYKSLKRKRGSTELQREWQRYQALPPKEREALAAEAGKRKAQGSTAKRANTGPVPASGEHSQ